MDSSPPKLFLHHIRVTHQFTWQCECTCKYFTWGFDFYCT